jgi:RNA polymerase sigma-70 factor, ECF subfamily
LTYLAVIPENPKDKFREFYDKYYQLIFRFISKRIRTSSEQVEDMIQDLFLSILPKFDQFNSSVKRLSYVLGIAKNKIIDIYRSKSTGRLSKTIYMSDLSSDKVDQFESKEKGTDKDTRQNIQFILNRLSSSYREILNYKYLLDYSVKEISDLIGKSEKATESLLNRARVKFKEISDKELGREAFNQ